MRYDVGDSARAIVALAAAGALWGLTVPLSKLGLEWLGAGWLAVARFAHRGAAARPRGARRAARRADPRRRRWPARSATARVILLQNVGLGARASATPR